MLARKHDFQTFEEILPKDYRHDSLVGQLELFSFGDGYQTRYQCSDDLQSYKGSDKEFALKSDL
jgi:hypothetical protein